MSSTDQDGASPVAPHSASGGETIGVMGKVPAAFGGANEQVVHYRFAKVLDVQSGARQTREGPIRLSGCGAQPAVAAESRPWDDRESTNTNAGNDAFNFGITPVSSGAVDMVQAGISITTAVRHTRRVVVAGQS